MNNKIPAVEKTIQLLSVLSERKGTQAELSKMLGISMSTTYRILMTLLKHRWVSKSDDGVYSLSSGLLPLTFGLSDEVNILERTCEKVTKISQKYQIACKISVRKEELQQTYFRAEPSGPVALTGHIGSTFPLIEGSVGAALLAEESDDTIQELLENCDADIPEKQNPELLYRSIEEVRKKGFVLNLRKNRWNIAACSIPLHSQTGSVIAAMTLIGTIEDFTGQGWKRIEKILKEIKNK